MKKIEQILCIMALAVLVTACNKDDAPKTTDPDPIGNPDPDPTPENHAPGSFALLSAQNNATDVDVLPEFIWEAATDPDGDPVKYDLYVGSAPDSLNKVAPDLGATSYTLDERLLLNSKYYWQVVAKDGLGKETAADLYNFTTRDIIIPDMPITTNPGYPKRDGFKPVVFNDTLWVIGGNYFSSEYFNDVWYSTNGTDWSRAKEHAEFPPRSGHSLTVFQNKLWLIGGITEDTDFLNDIWFSENGIDWNVASRGGNFSDRYQHTAIVFDEKFWIIGGFGGVDLEGDIVLVSNNGIQWEVVNTGAPFLTSRADATAAIFDDKLWVSSGIAGTPLADIWNTRDGVIWNEVHRNAPFDWRVGGDLIVFDDRLWMTGGSGIGFDTWSSTDGLNWSLEITKEEIPHQVHCSAVVFDNALLLLNWYDQDIWAIK